MKQNKLQNNTNKLFGKENNGWIYFASFLEFQLIDEYTVGKVLHII